MVFFLPGASLPGASLPGANLPGRIQCGGARWR